MTLEAHFGRTENHHLTLHGVDLVELGDRYGTPLFVFDEVGLIESYDRFRHAFETQYPKVMVCYSVKTNNNLAICQILRERMAYAEVASEQDLHVALKAGFPGKRIVYDGPFKPETALRTALDEEVLLINVESFTEMERLDALAREMGLEQAIGLRVNGFKPPGFFKRLHPNALLEASLGHPGCRFGFSLEELRHAFNQLQGMKHLRLEGLMMHPYRQAVAALLPLIQEAREEFGFELEYLNIGGGFNPEGCGSNGPCSLMVDYVGRKLGRRSKLSPNGNAASIESVAEGVIAKVRQQLGTLPEPTLIAEPGRFITGPCGTLLLRVDHTKRAEGYKWVLVDGGTNILPMMYDHRRVLVANRASESHEELVNIVGPLLYPKDFVAVKAVAPRVEENDVLALRDCGAYSLTSSTQFLYPRPAAVLIDAQGRVQVIREQETYDDVMAKDRGL